VYSTVCAVVLGVRLVAGIVQVANYTADVYFLTETQLLLMVLFLINVPEVVFVGALLLWMRYRSPKPSDTSVGLLYGEAQ
jgi:hypothetical protein